MDLIARLVIPVALGAVALSAAETISMEVRVSGREAASAELRAADFEIKEAGKNQTANVEYIGAGLPATGQTRLWLYVAVDVFPQDYPNTQKAVLKFIDEMLPPGVLVSLGGAPFTGNRDDLRRLLLPGPQLNETAIEGTAIPGVIPMWSVGNNARLSGRPMLARYTALARQLGALPGKKAVVLFRDALRLDRDGLDTGNDPIQELGTGGRGRDRIRSTLESNDAAPTQHREALELLGSEALRNRVSYYPVRPRPLTPSLDGPQGLNQIANATGGEPLLTEGDPAAIFERVIRDASDYYLLTYEPSDERQRGRKRRVSVKLNRKGLKASVLIDEYMERQPGEQAPPRRRAAAPDVLAVDDKAMRELLGTAKRDFPLDYSYAVFRGPDGNAAVIYAAGVHPGELKAVGGKDSVEADFSLGVQALNGGEEAAYASVRERRAFQAEEFKKALKDKRMRTNHAAALRGIEEGSYELRLAWRDEASGKASTARAQFAAPDFEKPLAASSLMITRDAVQGPPEIGNPLGELLAVGDTHFLPDASTTFAAGETLYIIYHLYNVPDAMLGQPPPVQFVVLQNQQPVANAPSGGDGIAMKEQNQIRYRVMLQTDQLKPGTYTVLAGLPSAGGGEPQILTKGFAIE